MRNIFLLYMPPTNAEAMLHYRETIGQRVPYERVARYLSQVESSRLRSIFGTKSVAVWGSRDSPANRSKFERMNEGDDLLIVEGDTIKLMGKIALKTVNADLSRDLWTSLGRDQGAGWNLIYFIANPLEIGVPFLEFCKLFEYEPTYQLRGFTAISAERLEAFYSRYDDLYSILLRIRDGVAVEAKHRVIERLPEAGVEPSLVELESDDIEEVLLSNLVSDHVRMQWTLLRLGLKAGDKVWIPVADQGKIRRAYEYNEFESAFASGIDLPHSYVENIDVVWKDEYRIDAAFEVENSTAIYSGLLRFADLTILAPNTVYPMLIVAPSDRRNRVREQLRRPTFGRLDLRNRVKFLPYEAVDDIDRFFGSSSSGLNAELIAGKAEKLV